MRKIVTRTLRQAGFDDWELTEATDGQDALSIIKRDEPDLVLSDWNMPNMTGIELLRALRAEGNDTPFGFVTSEGSTDMREAAEAAGALFLIAKPFTPESFRASIEAHLA